jgi:hypothetical protein
LDNLPDQRIVVLVKPLPSRGQGRIGPTSRRREVRLDQPQQLGVGVEGRGPDSRFQKGIGRDARGRAPAQGLGSGWGPCPVGDPERCPGLSSAAPARRTADRDTPPVTVHGVSPVQRGRGWLMADG